MIAILFGAPVIFSILITLPFHLKFSCVKFAFLSNSIDTPAMKMYPSYYTGATLICVISLALAGLMMVADAAPQPAAHLHDPFPGTLLNVTFRGVVGTLLPSEQDKLSNATLTALMDGLTHPPRGYWLRKAKDQIRLTLHRQVYRPRGQLTLPPESVWDITMDPDNHGYRIITQDGLILLTVEYEFHSVVVARRGSVHQAEVNTF